MTYLDLEIFLKQIFLVSLSETGELFGLRNFFETEIFLLSLSETGDKFSFFLCQKLVIETGELFRLVNFLGPSFSAPTRCRKARSYFFFKLFFFFFSFFFFPFFL